MYFETFRVQGLSFVLEVYTENAFVQSQAERMAQVKKCACHT